MADRTLTVKLIGDDRDLQKAFQNSERRAAQFDSRMTKTNQGLRGILSGAGSRTSLLFGSGAFLGTAAITAGIAKSIEAASNLNEEVTKSRQIFGDSSQEIEAWATTTTRSFGIARVQALAATGTFGNLFSTVGLGQDEAAGMSRALTELAADLASFNNADISDVLNAIRSGLIGEAEPLRRYGVLLSETRVQQLAMANTGKENVKELTNQEKALARFNIIMQDTAAAQGDFGRTSEGLANQSRILRANFADLSATMGTKLLPIVNRTIAGFNDMFDLFSQGADTFKGIEGLGDTLETIDISQVVALRDRLAEVKGEGDDVVGILDEIIRRLKDLQGVVVGGPDSLGGPRGPGAIAGSNALVEERNRQRNLAKQKRDLERSRKEFSEFTKGLGLKFDKAQLTKPIEDDVAALRELERAILRQIEREGKTFKLVDQLTQVRLQIQSTLAGPAEDQAEKSRDAYHDTIDALTLNLEVAEATKSFADDQQALRAIEQTIIARIRAEGQTTELLRDLFRNREQQAEVQRQIAEQQRERRQGRQFEAIGLTAEGDERTPGGGALLRRTRSLQDQIKGTVLDTAQTRSQLDRIAAVLKGRFGKVGREVRQAILAMLNDISQALEGDDEKSKGPLTKFAKRGVEELIEGLGLTEEQVKELRQRMAQLGRGGSAPGEGTGAFGFNVQPKTQSTRGADGAFERAIEMHVYIDGEEVEARVTKRQQKKKGRSAPSRRGTRPGV